MFLKNLLLCFFSPRMDLLASLTSDRQSHSIN